MTDTEVASARDTANPRIVVESDGDRETMTWSDFADANRELPELDEIADHLRKHGRATVGGGAATLTVVSIAD